MISVIIPAHNESAVIERTLGSVLAAMRQEPGEIIVVCNGCSDNTAEICRRFSNEIQVIELEQGSKIQALNAGDRAATGFPRFFLDADILVSEEAFREVAKVLRGGEIHAAAPRMVIRNNASSWWVKAFYRVWTETPYHRKGHVGSGLFAISERGRKRFDQFPQLIADDEFIRQQFMPSERQTVENCTFSVEAPRNLQSLVKVKTRSRLGNYQLRALYPAVQRNGEASRFGLLKNVVRKPRLWCDTLIYYGVVLMTTMRARRQFAKRRFDLWERDESSRIAPKAHPS